MRHTHLRALSKTPAVAQSNFGIKLDTTTEMIDRLLLVPRQMPWKIVAVGDGTTDTTDTDIDTGIVDEEL